MPEEQQSGVKHILTAVVLTACCVSAALLPATAAQRPSISPGQAALEDMGKADGAMLDATMVNIADILVEGASVYSRTDFAPYIESFRRKAVSLRQLHSLAETLTSRYRQDGYVLARVVVSASPIRDGIVRLQAQEGYIARVNLEGKAPARRAPLEGAIRALQQARPLTAAVLERNLLLLNDLVGSTATATLVPHREGVGAVQLNLRFEQRKYQGSVGVSNSASRSLGHTRAEAQIDVYALLGGFDRTSLALSLSGNTKYNALLLDHERAIGASGLKALAKIKALESRPGKKANRNLETRSHEAAAGLSYPILRSRSKNLYVSGTLSAHNGEIDLPELRASKDRTRSVRVAANFDATDRWQGVNTVELGLTQGLRGFGASENGSARLSRTQGRSDFTKLTLYAARLQALRDQWSLLGAVSGQYAFNDLLVPELFAFGGEQFGRGYDAAEIAGDHGAAAKVELRYSGANPQVGLSAYTLYGFWDGGKVWLRSPSAERGEKAKQSAASAGLGARMNIGASATTFVELAKPLTREVEQEGNKQARLFAGVNYRF